MRMALFLEVLGEARIIYLHVFYSFSDSTVQPKFYCILSPETSEDDISRLDSKVRLWPCPVLYSVHFCNACLPISVIETVYCTHWKGLHWLFLHTLCMCFLILFLHNSSARSFQSSLMEQWSMMNCIRGSSRSWQQALSLTQQGDRRTNPSHPWWVNKVASTI